jgi:hypothetical protein
VLFAYADPPYIGTAAKTYGTGEVDHKALLERLYAEFPAGWALSASMVSLWDILPMIPREWRCRIGAWCQPFGRIYSQSGGPVWAWEPVIFRGGRKQRRSPLPMDWLVANKPCVGKYHRDSSGFIGAKPDEFCYWLFELLNMRPEDEFVDLFPGTGRVGRAWETWKRNGMSLFVKAGFGAAEPAAAAR